MLFTVRDERSESDLVDKKIERSEIAPKFGGKNGTSKSSDLRVDRRRTNTKGGPLCEIQIVASSERVWQVLLDDQNIVSKPIRNAVRAIRNHTEN